MSFSSKLYLQSIRSTNRYKLTKDFSFYSLGYHLTVKVPKGFVTDFASIPAAIKFWMDDNAGYIRDAAVIHDYLYSRKSSILYPLVTRKMADVIIVEGMDALGASWAKKRAVYYALRSFGMFAYKKKQDYYA